MGNLLRRRELILPSGGEETWDYEWDYSMGLLSDNGWARTISGSASETLISTGDCLKSGGTGYALLQKADFQVPIGVIEVTFRTTGFGRGNQNTRICFSNGTNGIQIVTPRGQLCLLDAEPMYIADTETIRVTSLGVTLTRYVDYTLRLVLNGQVGEVWLDGVRLISDVDISTVFFAARTAIWSQNQQNYDTVVKSVKLRKNRI